MQCGAFSLNSKVILFCRRYQLSKSGLGGLTLWICTRIAPGTGPKSTKVNRYRQPRRRFILVDIGSGHAVGHQVHKVEDPCLRLQSPGQTGPGTEAAKPAFQPVVTGWDGRIPPVAHHDVPALYEVPQQPQQLPYLRHQPHTPRALHFSRHWNQPSRSRNSSVTGPTVRPSAPGPRPPGGGMTSFAGPESRQLGDSRAAWPRVEPVGDSPSADA